MLRKASLLVGLGLVLILLATSIVLKLVGGRPKLTISTIGPVIVILESSRGLASRLRASIVKIVVGIVIGISGSSKSSILPIPINLLYS